MAGGAVVALAVEGGHLVDGEAVAGRADFHAGDALERDSALAVRLAVADLTADQRDAVLAFIPVLRNLRRHLEVAAVTVADHVGVQMLRGFAARPGEGVLDVDEEPDHQQDHCG